MRFEYIDPFIRTALRVLGTVLQGSVRQGEVTALRADHVEGEVAITVRITGDSEGDIVITMGKETAQNISSALLDAPVDSLTSRELDALAELGNLIAGNTVSSLNDLGFDFTMHVPVATAGSFTTACGDREMVQIPLESGCGPLAVNVLLGAD